jgi:hypothetical protein
LPQDDDPVELLGQAIYRDVLLGDINPVASSSVGIEGGTAKPKKYIQHTTLRSFYGMYELWCDTAEITMNRASEKTFARRSKSWNSAIGMRKISQHARSSVFAYAILIDVL